MPGDGEFSNTQELRELCSALALNNYMQDSLLVTLWSSYLTFVQQSTVAKLLLFFFKSEPVLDLH